MKSLVINDRGVFEQETYMLTPYGITKRKHTVQLKIVRLRQQIQDKEMEIRNLKAEIEQEEKNLTTLNSPLVESFIAKEKAKQEEIHKKAQSILKECIGDELYTKLQANKKIIFTAKDNITYKIEDNGRVYRKVEKEYKQLCIIKPGNLPLPDFLLAMFVNLRENPSKYPLRRR
ncbi:MAG: hypothetical protein WC998_03450 [Candidatus Paceibacterota bacterium]